VDSQQKITPYHPSTTTNFVLVVEGMDGRYAQLENGLMEHDHRLIIVCDHVSSDGRIEMLWIQDGQVQAVMCIACAHAFDESEESPATVSHLCTECARIEGLPEGLPVTVQMADGFYERIDGQWVRQPDTSDVVN